MNQSQFFETDGVIEFFQRGLQILTRPEIITGREGAAFSTVWVARGSTGRSSRFGRSSTFFTGFGFGLGFKNPIPGKCSFAENPRNNGLSFTFRGFISNLEDTGLGMCH
jgi:hypothetical protein